LLGSSNESGSKIPEMNKIAGSDFLWSGYFIELKIVTFWYAAAGLNRA
jgi:hypothetical protein